MQKIPTAFYLAAAVSDFYLPPDKMAEHKIQSRSSSAQLEGSLIEGEPLTLTLDPVPKLLGQLKVWHPDAVVISFKLETDSELLVKKAQSAISKYGVDLVVANLLQLRMDECVMVKSSGTETVTRTGKGSELEEAIVAYLN